MGQDNPFSFKNGISSNLNFRTKVLISNNSYFQSKYEKYLQFNENFLTFPIKWKEKCVHEMK